MQQRSLTVGLPQHTIRQLIRTLGGQAAVAKQLGVAPVTVKMWSYRACIPRSRLEAMLVWLRQVNRP